MSAWLEALLGKVLNSGVSIPLSKGLNFTGGLAAALNPSTKQIDVVASPTQANANTLAPLLRGSGLTVGDGSALQPRGRLRKVMRIDHFLGGSLTSGGIGDLNWGLFGNNTPTFAKAGLGLNSSNRTALSTGGAVANDRGVLKVGDTESRACCVLSDVLLQQCVWRHDSDLTSKRVFFGLMGDFSEEPSAATHCLGIYYDSGVGPNYQIIARAGGVGAPVDTGVAVPEDTGQLVSIYQPTPGTVEFRIGDSVIGTLGSGLPTQVLSYGWRVQTLTGAARRVRLGGFYFESQPITGAFDDDDFLEE